MGHQNKKITLILTGGIACYKVLDLIRILKKQGYEILPIMTQGAKAFITPMAVASLAQAEVHDDLWSLKNEVEIGHIQLAREADLVLVAPATANFMAKVAHGLADDLASTVMLATDAPILYVPAMNPHMYANLVTQANIQVLQERGAHFVTPDTGLMACNEAGVGRYPEQDKILSAIETVLGGSEGSKSLEGKSVLITLGGTQEAIDPLRFISNHSSGRQGLEIALALHKAGATVRLLKAHTTVPIPEYFKVYDTLTGQAMSEQATDCLANEKIDIAICAAAVCDWRVASQASQKLKKGQATLSQLEWVENPDILKQISKHSHRPKLVIGFAAETDNIQDYAKAKLDKKGCDYIIYNQAGVEGVGFGESMSQSGICSQKGCEDWGKISKPALATNILEIINEFYHSKGV